jgi:hypothetical protein
VSGLTGITGLHIGRSWVSHYIEDECPCDKAPCGLAISGHPDCPEHSLGAAKTLRQGHRSDDCPGPTEATP